uniref:Integrase catalytic domain-containing protein n=1 Tax=Panagrolaimus davidi TaxID=227884 RepID=A0A914P6G8_9BILA
MRIDYDKIKADNQDVNCNFNNYNQHAQDAFRKISAPHRRGCGGEKLSLRKIFSELAETGSNLYGAMNVVDLLYSRIGQFELDWSDREQVNRILDENICKQHFKELYAEFETTKSGHARLNSKGKLLCIYNNIFAPQSQNCPLAVNNKITKNIAAVFALELNEITVVIQPGAGFCKKHWSDMMKSIGQNQEEESDEENENEDEDMDSANEPESPDLSNDEDFQPNQSLDAEVDAEKIAVINKLGDHMGVQKIITKDSYNDLSCRTKRDKVATGRKIHEFFAAIMAPGAEKEFGAKVCSIYQPKVQQQTKAMSKILEAGAQQYQRATDKITKQIILGPLAATCSYREVYQHVPGLSYYLYNKARKCFNAEEIPEDLPKEFYRYDELKIRDFVEFFTSPHCMVLLPYGEKSVKLSNGEKLDVAANMRMQSHKQIIRMYRKKLEEEGRTGDALPLSTMYAILKHCHAAKSKELTCVDYYLAAALDGFDELAKIVDYLMSTEDLTVEESKNGDCENLEELEFKEIETDYAVFNVLELRSHIVRSTWSEMERGKDISELDATKAYITFDWAQKYLPTKYRETQKDYFGKDGMSYHITHVQTVDENGDPFDFAFLHIIEQNKQDATAVIAIALDVLKKLKTMGFTSAIFRSDNAGCYHSKEVILSLAEISTQSEVLITKFSFSEPQNGKGNCDRIAALAKNKARRFVCEGNNINDEKGFYNALEAEPGISYTTLILATVKRSDQVIKTTALKGIASYYVFTPQEDGILVHRAANIGVGKFFQYNKANVKLTKIPYLEKSKEKTFGKIDNEDSWKSGKTRNRADASGDECHIFDCHYEHCDFTSSSYAEYMKHIVFLKHGKVNLMRDYSAIIYQDAVKQKKPDMSNLVQAIQSERNVDNIMDDETAPERGWGHRKPKKLPKITKRAEEYVRKKFNDGLLAKAKKWKPKDLAIAMKKAKEGGKSLFRPNEILFAEQIQQLFSKFAAEQKKAPKKPPIKKQKTTEQTTEQTCEERLSDLETEGENLEDCMDDDTRQNRQTNIITRARRLEFEQETEESIQNLLAALKD